MEIYKNDFKKNEDEMMWELHEIRHQLYEEYKTKNIYLNASKRSINSRINIACNLFDTNELIEISV